MASKLSLKEIEGRTIKQYVQAHVNWSIETFGLPEHTEGLLRHIEKECQEIRAENTTIGKAKEFVDIIILAIDAMWRLGLTPREIAAALIEKQQINEDRKYPPITDENEPTEHIRE